MNTQRISLSNLKPEVKEKLINGKLLISAAIGASGAFALMAATDIDKMEIPLPDDDSLKADDGFVEFQTEGLFGTADDSLSFAQAFRSQRDELGPGGIFEYRGKYYNTFYKEEWDSMSDQEKNDYYASVEKYIDYDKVTHTSAEGVANDLNIDTDLDTESDDLGKGSEAGGETDYDDDSSEEDVSPYDDTDSLADEGEVEVQDGEESDYAENESEDPYLDDVEEDDLTDPSLIDVMDDESDITSKPEYVGVDGDDLNDPYFESDEPDFLVDESDVTYNPADIDF